MRTFFSNLKIAHKLLASSLVFLLPVVVLALFVFASFNRDIHTVRMEKDGLRLIRPLSVIMESLPTHRHYAHSYLQGDPALLERIKPVTGRIRGAFSDFFSVSDGLEQPLRIDDASLDAARLEEAQPARIYRYWEKMHAEWNTLSPRESDARHHALHQAAQALFFRIGDTSSLLLDPDSDSCHLATVSLRELPGCQEAAAEVMLLGMDALTARTLTPETRTGIASAAGRIEKVFLDRIRRDLETALREDSRVNGESQSLQQALPPAFARYEQALVLLLDKARLLTSVDTPALSPEEFETAGTSAIEAGDALWTVAVDELDRLLDLRAASLNRKRAFAGSLGLLALALAFGMVFLVARSIARPLAVVSGIADAVSGGDMAGAGERIRAASRAGFVAVLPDGDTRDTSRHSEVDRLFRAMALMTGTIESLLDQVALTGDQVAVSAGQISESVRRLEETVSQQAASTSEVTATSREISGTVNELARTMSRVAALAAETGELAGTGVEGLEDIRSSMQELTDSTADITARLNTFRERTDMITEVITAITRVASQTNMLSLNATIEAEKAGEYGSGFAVVAREISRLADQTAIAALDIEEMILEMQTAVRDGVDAVERHARRTRESSERTARISDDLGRVIEHARRLGSPLEQVNQGMQMQSESAQQISVAMEQLTRGARLTRDSLSDFRVAAGRLNDSVTGLREVTRFSRGDGGRA